MKRAIEYWYHAPLSLLGGAKSRLEKRAISEKKIKLQRPNDLGIWPLSFGRYKPYGDAKGESRIDKYFTGAALPEADVTMG
jgi:hypothetical protein